MSVKFAFRTLFSAACLCSSFIVCASTTQGSDKITTALQQQILSAEKSKTAHDIVIELSSDFDVKDIPSQFKKNITAQHKKYIQLKIPVSEIKSFALMPEVLRIRQPYRAHSLGITSEAINDIQALPIQQRGTNGNGAHVVVLDIGFAHYTSLLGTELPDEVAMKNFNSNGSALTIHGTAVAEIIHDIAPGAQMTFVAIGSDVEYLQAIDWIKSMDPKPHVVNASIGFDNVGPLNNKGVITQAANSLLSHNILYVNAAGNEQQQYYIAQFSDANGNGWHDFATGDEFFALELNGEEPYEVILNWDDWGSDPANPHSSQNYDLYLWCPGTAELTFDTACATSIDNQDGSAGSTPLEIVSDPSPLGGVYYVGIKRKSGTTNNLMRVSFVNEAGHFGLEYRTHEGTLVIPADGNNVLTVGAYNWHDVGADLNPGISRNDPGFSPSDWLNDLPPEYFSSLGPTWDNRRKPDMSGPDGVSTASYGEQGFYGTSAAAPHVAGAAALLKSESETRDARELRRLLIGMASDVQPQGMDNYHGAGRLSLMPTANQQGLSSRTGLWSNSEQQGHGYSVIIQGNTAVVIWYFYDKSGDPVWMLGHGTFDGTSFSTTLTKFTGPAYGSPMASSFDAIGTHIDGVEVGSLSMEFMQEMAHIDVSLNGEDNMAKGSYSVDVTMLVAGIEASEFQTPYITDQNGIWNNSDIMGQGIFQIRSGNTHSPDRYTYPSDTEVVIWYTYERETGQSQWLLSAGITNDADSYDEAGAHALTDTLFRYYLDQGIGFGDDDTLEDFFHPHHNPVHFMPLVDTEFRDIASPEATLNFKHRFHQGNDSYSVKRFDFY